MNSLRQSITFTPSVTMPIDRAAPATGVWKVLLVLLVLGAGCDSPSAGADYSRGYMAGYTAGNAVGDSIGYKRGFDAGFQAARPGLPGPAPTGAWRVVSIIIVLLGMLKLVLALVIFTIYIIGDSKNHQESWAKAIASTLSVIVLFWLANSLSIGFTHGAQDYILGAAASDPFAKLTTGAFAGLLTFAAFWVLERLVRSSSGHRWIGTILVFVSSGLSTLMVVLFFSMRAVPNINSYRFFDLVCGVVIGGVAWIVVRLLVASER